MITRRVCPEFGISQFTTTPWSFDEDLDPFARARVKVIEIVEDKLDDVRWAEQMSAVSKAGLTISGIQLSVRIGYPSRMMPAPIDLPARLNRLT